MRSSGSWKRCWLNDVKQEQDRGAPVLFYAGEAGKTGRSEAGEAAMNNTHHQIGRSLPVRDARGKVSGTTRYVGDMQVPGMLEGVLVLSPHPHARIRGIDAASALAMPGVAAVLTHENTPENRYNGAAPFEDHSFPCQERLFSPVVRFAGDRVALVLAQNREQALRASRKLRVDYECLDFVLAPRQALETEAPQVDPAGNLGGTCRQETGDWDQALNTADQVVETRLRLPPYHQGAMETHGVLVQPDASGDLLIYTPSQNIWAVRFITADILELPQSRVRVIRTPLGGSFGGKLEVILEPLAAYAARLLNRPVKLILDRRQTIQASRVSYGLDARMRTTLQEGEVTGLELDLVADAGGYLSSGEDFVWAMSAKPFRLYRIPSIRYLARSALTNKPVASAMRGYGSTQLMTALEIHIDRVARALGTDPLNLRRRLCVRQADHDPRTGKPYGRISLRQVLEQGAQRFGRLPGERWSDSRFFYGTGMSLGVHGNGMHPVHFDTTTVALKMNRDGSVNLITGTVDMGTGTTTAFTQIVGEVLGLDACGIGVVEGDTSAAPFDLGCYASRSISVAGEAVLKAARAMENRLKGFACRYFECEQAVELVDGQVRLADGRKVGTGELARWIHSQTGEDLYVHATHSASTDPMSYAAHFAQVRVCRKTGQIRVQRYCASHDPGQMINPAGLEGQIEGAVSMGIGMALSEGLSWGDDGTIETNTLGGCHLLKASEMPELETVFSQQQELSGPFGARSFGEISCVPVPAAVVNAVACARGTDVNSLPVGAKKRLNRNEEHHG